MYVCMHVFYWFLNKFCVVLKNLENEKLFWRETLVNLLKKKSFDKKVCA